MFSSSSDSSIFSKSDKDSDQEKENEKVADTDFIYNRDENIENVKLYNKYIMQLFLKNQKYYEQMKSIVHIYLEDKRKSNKLLIDAKKGLQENQGHNHNFYLDMYDIMESGMNNLLYYVHNDYHKFIDVVNNYSIPFFFRLIFLNIYLGNLRSEQNKKERRNLKVSTECDEFNETEIENKNISNVYYEKNNQKEQTNVEPRMKYDKTNIHNFIEYDFKKNKKFLEEFDVNCLWMIQSILYLNRHYSFMHDELEKYKINSFLCRFYNEYKIQFRCRIIHVPYLHDMYLNNLGDIENKHIGKFITVDAIITRVGEKKILEKSKKFKCSKCDYVLQKNAIPELYYNNHVIYQCPNYILEKNNDANTVIEYAINWKGGKKKFANSKTKQKKSIFGVNTSKNKKKEPQLKRCTGKTLELMESEIERIDYQEIKIREINKSNMPFSVTVVLLENLVGKFLPGTKITINGLVLRRWKKLYKDFRCDTELFIEANNVDIRKMEIGVGKELEISVDENFLTRINEFYAQQLRDLNDKNNNNNNNKSMHLNDHTIMKPIEQDQTLMNVYKEGKTNENHINVQMPDSLHNISNVFLKYWFLFKDNQREGMKYICESICPNLFNCKLSKLSLLLVLIGGNKSDENGSCYEEDNKWSKYFLTEKSEINAYKEEKEKRKETHKNKKRNHTFTEHEIRKKNFERENNDESVNNKKNNNEEKKQGASEKYHRRTICHMLLVGDPGTGKSQLLKEVKKLSNICVNVSGMFCTTAGLTCAAVKEGKDFMLDAGALVLADNGICCIDEFCLMKNENKLAIHEAMEQLSISVAKAGIVDVLNCRCTIIGASNFEISKKTKGSILNNNEQLLLINLSYALLSRFDLIVIMHDDKNIDEQIADTILSQDTKDKKLETNYNIIDRENKRRKRNSEESNPSYGSISLDSRNINLLHEKKKDHDPSIRRNKKDTSIIWPSEKLKEYISYVKNNFSPIFDSNSQLVLITYYSELRKFNNGDNGTTIRTLEALIRLSESFSKLKCSSFISASDVIHIILLMELNLKGYQIGIKTTSDEESLMARSGLLSDIYNVLNEYNNLHDTKHSLDDVLFVDFLFQHFKKTLLEKLELKEDNNGDIQKVEKIHVFV